MWIFFTSVRPTRYFILWSCTLRCNAERVLYRGGILCPGNTVVTRRCQSARTELPRLWPERGPIFNYPVLPGTTAKSIGAPTAARNVFTVQLYCHTYMPPADLDIGELRSPSKHATSIWLLTWPDEMRGIWKRMPRCWRRNNCIPTTESGAVYMSSTIFHRYTYYTCNALRLLFGRQKGHPANKKPSVGMLVVLTWL